MCQRASTGEKSEVVLTSETAQGGCRLVIVESPAKAKTIKGYLGPGYVVEASVGHIFATPPEGAAEVPEKYTGEAAPPGVDVDHDFQPIYVVNADKKAQVRKPGGAARRVRRALPRHR